MTRALMEGSEAIAEAALAAGCRFFAGYPMTPFTELLEHFAKKLPGHGGVCINAESELEAVGMAWGALATGARAATGSTGQGIALMQESLSEITRAELPLVVFNMARGQGDYFQATRGGGHGDYLLAHTAEAVEIAPASFPPLPPKDWAVDGSLGGSGRSRNVNPLGMEKGKKGIEPEPFWQRLAQKHEEMARRETRFELVEGEGAELVVVAFGTLARFARHAVRELRRAGARVALFRPITLWPFPSDALRQACAGATRVAVLEQNAGQMIDDVRLALEGRLPVSPIGGISSDSAGFGIGPLLDPDEVRGRIQRALAGETR